MSRYPQSDYRGPRDRSRSPPRFADRRASTASIFDSRPPALPRTTSDFPRGPRTPFDGPRASPNGATAAAGSSRPVYASLRDAPPLGSGDRGRPYREREYDRRERPSPSRERSPFRGLRDSRDLPPRDLDASRARRESRDEPPPAGPNFSDSQPFTGSTLSRGGFARGRGRGDYSTKGGRGGRSNFDEPDLFRRERSPQPRWGRDLSRDSRDSDRREDRRFERPDNDRRSLDWPDRERERELDRGRQEPQPAAPLKLETRTSSESMAGMNPGYTSSQAPHVNPARLALIESTGADASVRRTSVQLEPPPAREARKDQIDSSTYSNRRSETVASRYGARGSSPPTQAPPVPAFTLSFAPQAAVSAPLSSIQASKSPQAPKPFLPTSNEAPRQASEIGQERKPDPRQEAPSAPRIPPVAPKAQLVSPPPATAPKAPRALESAEPVAASSRAHNFRPVESLNATVPTLDAALDSSASVSHVEGAKLLPTLVERISPNVSQSKVTELNPPTGPRASRVSPALASVSPRPPFASPRSDLMGANGGPRVRTPPPSAPLGPRNQSYSVSPKVPTSSIPTAPKGNRGTSLAPRVPDRGPVSGIRGSDKSAVTQGWTGSRNLPQWNQWRRPGAPLYGDRTIPAKRDISGEEKPSHVVQNRSMVPESTLFRHGGMPSNTSDSPQLHDQLRRTDEMQVDIQPPKRQNSMMAGHSAARSFFGQPTKGEGEESGTSDNAPEPLSSSEEDDSDIENDLALFNAKFERQKRQLEAQMVDLSSRRYRATTPLENLARLARISSRDLERYNEQREHAMDVDRSPVARRNHMVSPTRRSSDSGDAPDIVTPKDDVEPRVAIHSSDDSSDGIRRVRRPTPEPVNLPYLMKGARPSMAGNNAFQDDLKTQRELTADVLDAMEEEMQLVEDKAAEAEDAFAAEYHRWREECEDLDRIREEQATLERQQSLEPKPEIDTASTAPMNPMMEGRRLYKFSSEYEIEQVIKQSEETARLEQERQDREARKNQADMEKEARIPDQLTQGEAQRSVFVDTNRYRDPEELTTVMTYLPPPDDFTEQEQHLFIVAFKDTPKKWGEISSLFPKRSYQDCIRHYYANKWDGRFRDNRTKKLKAGGRRGRGGARGPRGRVGGIMADLARVEDLLPPDQMSEKGRPRRAAAPTTFAEKEAEAKANLLGPSPAKKSGPGSKADLNGEIGAEKPGKRQKRGNGEKVGRKTNKANQHPLAQLAAAPQGSLGKQFMHGVHSKEDLADANLLASLHGGPHGIAHNPELPAVYHAEPYMHQMMQPAEDIERAKLGGQAAAAKQGASSYWSVPEQNDFVKYIGYFGRDFGAIATHMGTKTQTMIKNHYMRQVDGGNRPDLERAANDADERRLRGEDIGLPPTPTPIQKRKYENPPATAQRQLAPQSENSELEESGPPQRMATSKHTSPQQYAPQPRFTTSIPTASIPASRVAASPLATSAAPLSSLSGISRPLQNPLGSRFTFLPDSRSDPLAGGQAISSHRPVHDSPIGSQMSQQGRSAGFNRGAEFIRNLEQEQERALRIQERQFLPDFPERQQMNQPTPRTTAHGSPSVQATHHPAERKSTMEDRPPSPPRGTAFTPGPSQGMYGVSRLGSLNPFSGSPSSLSAGRFGFMHSPPKREELRMGMAPSAVPATQPTTIAPPPEPKRSSVMSLLNSEPEGPKPVKRESFPPPSVASPVHRGWTSSTARASSTEGIAPRREPSFGQPSLPLSHFRRESFSKPVSTPTSAVSGLKNEPSGGNSAIASAPKPDWAARVLGQTSQPSPPTPTLERDGRPMYQHRSILGSLGQSRGIPSPPPLGTIPHSRTPSLSAAANQPPRERLPPGLPSQQPPSSQQALSNLKPNPYASSSQQQAPFPQQQPGHAHGQSHLPQRSPLSGPFPTFHQRSMSRDDLGRQDQPLIPPREREDPEMRWRPREAPDDHRRLEDQYRHLEQERDRQRQQSLQRQPPPALPPPAFSASSAFGQGRITDIRSQSRLESEMAIREEQERLRAQQDVDRRRQEGMMVREREQVDDTRRRQQEDPLFRRPPFGVPPPAPRR